MQREWLSEAGYRLVFQRRSTGRSFVWLFFDGMAVIAREYDYYQQATALREAETLAGLGRMQEVSDHALGTRDRTNVL